MNSKKSWRAFVASLLVVVLLTNSGGVVFAHPASSAQEGAAASDETKITAEEEREAREFAERFVRRMRETRDLTPLVGEMFVPDYAARLRQEASHMPLALLSRSAVEQASGEELVRYQLAVSNSIYLASLLSQAYKTSPAAKDDDQEWGAAYYKRMLPPDIIELCRNDPILKALLEDDSPESAEEKGSAAPSPENSGVIDHDDEPILSVEQLRGFTSTLEQAITLARRHLDAWPSKPAFADRRRGAGEEGDRAAGAETLRPRAWTLNREFFGYPAGTRNFCVNASIFHLDLIRVDGKLRVLALSFEMD